TLALSRDGGLLACADSSNAVHVWDLASHRDLAVLRAHAGEVRCLAFSPDGHRIVSGGEDRSVYLRSWRDENVGAKPAGALVSPTDVRLALSPDGTRLAAADSECGLRIWETASGQPVPPPAEASTIAAVAYSPDGRWLAGGGADARIRLWEGGGRPPVVLEGS